MDAVIDAVQWQNSKPLRVTFSSRCSRKRGKRWRSLHHPRAAAATAACGAAHSHG